MTPERRTHLHNLAGTLAGIGIGLILGALLVAAMPWPPMP